MARGPTNEARMLNSAGASQVGQANSLESNLIPTYESMLSEGYTPGEEAAMTSSGMGALGSSYGAAGEDAARAAARTNNSSSLGALEDKLALDKGTAMGDEAAGLQKGFADARLANQRFGAEGLSGLFNTNENEAGNMYGLGTRMFKPKGGNMPGFSFGIGPTGPSFGISG